jgi:hypothetical protein
MPVVAGVGVAMFAAALERPLDAAEIVGAAARLRGADDRGSPDLIALRANVVTQVGAPTFESAYSRGRSMDRETRSPGWIPRCLSTEIRPGEGDVSLVGLGAGRYAGLRGDVVVAGIDQD